MERKEPSGPQPIASAIRAFLKESGLRRPAGDERTFRAWSDAAGARWKEHATPVSFRGGQLVVEVRSSVHLAELIGRMDAAAKEGHDSFYVEVLARHGHRKTGKPKPGPIGGEAANDET